MQVKPHGRHYVGRRGDADITLFDSVGFAIEDFSALRYVRDKLATTGLFENLDLLGSRLLAHVLQALPPILLAFVLSLPIAKLIAVRGWLRTSLTAGAGLLYAIPSLPLFIVLPLFLGTCDSSFTSPGVM